MRKTYNSFVHKTHEDAISKNELKARNTGLITDAKLKEI